MMGLPLLTKYCSHSSVSNQCSWYQNWLRYSCFLFRSRLLVRIKSSWKTQRTSKYRGWFKLLSMEHLNQGQPNKIVTSKRKPRCLRWTMSISSFNRLFWHSRNSRKFKSPISTRTLSRKLMLARRPAILVGSKSKARAEHTNAPIGGLLWEQE